MSPDEELTIKRFKELADRCYSNNIYTFTTFLNMLDIDLFFRMSREISYVDFSLSGGCSECDRKILRFGSEQMLGYSEPFPISAVRVQPVLAKFADELTHRDFLGAIMNLGIERDRLGDIKLMNNTAVIYCLNSVADFIINELSKVKHTNIKCSLISLAEAGALFGEQQYETMNITVASERTDLIAAKLLNQSRSNVLELFQSKQFFVNSRVQENNSAVLKKGDILSIRGFGKFIYDGAAYTNKKGKLCVTVRKYV